MRKRAEKKSRGRTVKRMGGGKLNLCVFSFFVCDTENIKLFFIIISYC